MPSERAMLTKKMSRERVSVSRLRHTPRGVWAMRSVFWSGLMRMNCCVHFTSNEGSRLKSLPVTRCPSANVHVLSAIACWKMRL